MRVCLTFAKQFGTNTNSAASLAVRSEDFADLNVVVQATILAICSIDCSRSLKLALADCLSDAGYYGLSQHSIREVSPCS